MKRNILHLSNESTMDKGEFVLIQHQSPLPKKVKINHSDNMTDINNIKLETNGNFDRVKGSKGILLNDDLDEGLYSRQLYVLGKEAMKKMAVSDILICGLDGLGVEIAKNVILSGVKSVTLWDSQMVTVADFSSQFYLNEMDIGENRAKACFSRLAELNPYVNVSYYDGDLSREYVLNFKVVVLCNSVSDKFIIDIDHSCNTNNTAFIMGNTKGLAGQIFCDFGLNFTCHDLNGEPNLSVMISFITKEENAVVTCLDESRHGFEDGDYVNFSEIKGMIELNQNQPIPIKVLGPYTFSIGDTRSYAEYLGGGIAHQVKIPKKIEFKNYQNAFLEGAIVASDCAKMDHPAILHLAFRSLYAFYDKFGRFPSLDSAGEKEDLVQYLAMAQEFKNVLNSAKTGNSEILILEEREIKYLTVFFKGVHGQLCPLNSVIGGVAAQEVMKACSGKFNPIHQWFYFDAFECLDDGNYGGGKEDLKDVPEHYKRYSSQILIFGSRFQDKLAEQNCFLVGAGAIGCELLKLFAMIGLSCSPSPKNVFINNGNNNSTSPSSLLTENMKGGRLVITDMDNIEKSNLNRQFLFRPWDVNALKSDVARLAAVKMNPSFNVIAHSNRVGPETERTYDDDFFQALNIVINALDNVDARIYMDRRCIYYRKPLLESGTLGTKGNTQVILPDMTESYSSSNDPPEKSIPICTLKNFPNQIEHCIQWARDLFEGYFKQAPSTIQQYISNAQNITNASTDKDKITEFDLYSGLLNPSNQGNNLNQNIETLQILKSGLVDEKCANLVDAVTWARKRFEELFNSNISQLLFNFPPDQLTNSGAPFWSGPKRCPKPIIFNSKNAMHMDFILAGTLLRCKNYGIIPEQSGQDLISTITSLVDKVELPKFIPKSGVRIFVSDNEASASTNSNASATAAIDSNPTNSSALDTLKNALPSPSQLIRDTVIVKPIDFEKDDDTNYHMHFVTATSNLRATNYSISPADHLQTKQIAGKIIPAIATSTAVVAGLVCLELYKIVLGKSKLEDYKNGFFNLALPYMDFSEPLPPKKLKYYDNVFTLWDRIEIQGDVTLQEFLKLFSEKHKLEITMLSHGVSMLFSFFTAPDKKKERLPMKMSELVRRVTKRKIDPWVHSLVFELCTNDTSGEDVEIPYVKYNLPPNFHHQLGTPVHSSSKTPPINKKLVEGGNSSKKTTSQKI